MSYCYAHYVPDLKCLACQARVIQENPFLRAKALYLAMQSAIQYTIWSIYRRNEAGFETIVPH